MFSKDLPYSVVRHSALERELLARATAPIGWRGRGLFTDEQLEPYRLMRDLRFEAFQTELRDVVIQGLNKAISLAGNALGFEAHVVLHGVPGHDDVAREVRRVKEGPGPDVSLQSVLRPFY
jgi:hypothetical protein